MRAMKMAMVFMKFMVDPIVGLFRRFRATELNPLESRLRLNGQTHINCARWQRIDQIDTSVW
jgi:hypothetical protein